MKPFEGKVALVTGAGRGLGRALACALAEGGARVAANDLAPGSLDGTVERIAAGGGVAQAFLADVSKKMPVQAMIEEVRDAFERIDILINNAAVEPHAGLLTMDQWDWDRTLAVNLTAPFLTTQSVGRVMEDQGGGVIVNIGAASGTTDEGHSAYRASKMGLIGLTREAARELAAHGIRVNLVCPKETEPRSAASLSEDWAEDPPAGLPGDVVGLVLALCGEAASGITGHAYAAVRAAPGG